MTGNIVPVWSIALALFSAIQPDPVHATITADIRSNAGEKPVGDELRGCANPFDSYTLIVKNNAKIIAAQDICAGVVDVKVVVDRRQKAYVLLGFEQGHGTMEALTDHMAVYRVGKGLAACWREMIGAAAGPGSNWWYSRSWATPAGGGIVLSLKRHMHGLDVEDFPHFKSRVVQIDTPGNPCLARERKTQVITGNGLDLLAQDRDFKDTDDYPRH